jgi:hypothetical protein
MVPGLLLRYNAFHFSHATWFDFDPQPPTAVQSENKQRAYGESL